MTGDKSTPLHLTWAKEVPNGVELNVWVVPRSSKEAIGEVKDGRVRVHLTSPPVDGAANEALVRLIASLFSLRQRDVAIVQGHQSRKKRVRVMGATMSTAAAIVFKSA